MTRSRWIAAAVATAVAGYALAAWWGGEEAVVRRRLSSFASSFNAPAGEGLGRLSQAARLGQYFTDDVRVDLGPGTMPIEGRATLMGMAARLQPRTASFELELEDVIVDLTSDTTADVSLTAVFRRRSTAGGEDSLDAREFALAMVKPGAEWLVSRVTVIDTLR